MSTQQPDWETVAKEFLDKLYPNISHTGDRERPVITLTFAQTLDGKIAGPDRTPIILSSPPSMLLTHYIRNRNQGILVGIGTVLNDNPSLTVRHISLPSAEIQQPRPIILDSQLRFPTACKLLQHPKSPIILTRRLTSTSALAKKQVLEGLGVKIIECPDAEGGIDLEFGLRYLYHHERIESVMVEGGARVIGHFLSQKRGGGGWVDLLIITTAPKIIGPLGTPSLDLAASEKVPQLGSEVSYCQLGPDMVTAIVN